MAMASQNQTKRGDVRIYFVSCMLFVCIVAGGAFLGMYIALPESESSSWYPTAGMILVGIPWIFWLLTLLYTWIKRISGIGTPSTPNNKHKQQQQQQQQRTSTPPTNVGRNSGSVTTATTSTATESPVGSGGDGGGGGGGGEGGGAGHVRFGPAVVMGNGEDDNNNNNHQNNVMDGSSSSLDGDRELGDDHSRSTSSHMGAKVSSSNNNGAGSSIGSHESELPLFSMSS